MYFFLLLLVLIVAVVWVSLYSYYILVYWIVVKYCVIGNYTNLHLKRIFSAGHLVCMRFSFAHVTCLQLDVCKIHMSFFCQYYKIHLVIFDSECFGRDGRKFSELNQLWFFYSSERSVYFLWKLNIWEKYSNLEIFRCKRSS